jgi:hypothetical protein
MSLDRIIREYEQKKAYYKNELRKIRLYRSDCLKWLREVEEDLAVLQGLPDPKEYRDLAEKVLEASYGKVDYPSPFEEPPPPPDDKFGTFIYDRNGVLVRKNA